MRGQVPGNIRNEVRTNSAINNPQASSYIRAPEGVARRGIRAKVSAEGLGRRAQPKDSAK